MMMRLVSCLFWSFLTVTSIVLFPVAVVVWVGTAPFDRRKVVLHQLTCFWASLYTWLNPAWPVTITGREKLKSTPAQVIVSNHLSLLDILVLFRLFSHYKWVSKIENFRVPFIGWNMSLNGYIKLKRGDRQSAMQMIRECQATLASGSSIMMFPEGTRSPTGRMRSFKSGAFEIAIKTGSPIQPLVIDGSANALPKAGFVLKGRHPISVTVLDAIPSEDFGNRNAEELALYVRGLIAEQLEQNAKARETLPLR